MVPNIKWVNEGTRVKEFRVTGNLNYANTKMIMDNITPQIEIRAKIIYSFKSEIHRSAGEIVECEQKRLDLESIEVWSKAYLPATRQLRHKVMAKAK